MHNHVYIYWMVIDDPLWKSPIYVILGKSEYQNGRHFSMWFPRYRECYIVIDQSKTRDPADFRCRSSFWMCNNFCQKILNFLILYFVMTATKYVTIKALCDFMLNGWYFAKYQINVNLFNVFNSCLIDISLPRTTCREPVIVPINYIYKECCLWSILNYVFICIIICTYFLLLFHTLITL